MKWIKLLTCRLFSIGGDLQNFDNFRFCCIQPFASRLYWIVSKHDFPQRNEMKNSFVSIILASKVLIFWYFMWKWAFLVMNSWCYYYPIFFSGIEYFFIKFYGCIGGIRLCAVIKLHDVWGYNVREKGIINNLFHDLCLISFCKSPPIIRQW